MNMVQELMTPHEAAKWFRRSPSWLRHQPELLRVGGPGVQPLYHVRVCRAYLLGRLCGLEEEALRRMQIAALAADCGVTAPALAPIDCEDNGELQRLRKTQDGE